MVVFALILLFFANNQSPAVLFDSFGTEAATGGNYLPAFALGMFMALFVVYGFDTAGTFGEETVDASRQAPRGVLWSVAISGIVGTIFLIAVILAIPSMPDAIAEGQALGFPIATTIQATLTAELIAGITVGEVYLFVILASVFVCTLAIQGAATRMMFSMSRDRHLPLGVLWGRVNRNFRTPANAAIAVGVLAAIPILVIGPLGGFSVSIAATGLIYLSYLLTNLGVLGARFRGWPHKPAWFNLGRWGKAINIAAIVYGGLMLINIAPLAGPQPVRQLRWRRTGDYESNDRRLHQTVRQRDRWVAGVADLRDACPDTDRHRRDLLRRFGSRTSSGRRGRHRNGRGDHRLNTGGEEVRRRGEGSARRLLVCQERT